MLETHLHRVVSVRDLVLDNVLRRPRVLEAHELHEFIFHVLFAEPDKQARIEQNQTSHFASEGPTPQCDLLL